MLYSYDFSLPADAYQRAKYEHDNNIDPLYESEDDDADAAKHGWTLSEVRQRVNVFTLPAGGPDEKAKTVVYKGSSIRPAVLRPIEPLPPSAAPGAVRLFLSIRSHESRKKN